MVDQEQIQQLMQRIDMLEQLSEAMRTRSLFGLYEVETKDDLADIETPPPALAYCREDGAYYFKYPWSSDLANTPFHSVIGNGWHNMDSPCPRYDRAIHIIRTQWLNGWNLDYFPDYIDISQGGHDAEYLEDVFGKHYGPPSKQGVITISPKVVTIDGAFITGDTEVYITGLDSNIQLNPLCIFSANNNNYSITTWDGNNNPPHWIGLSPALETDLETGTFGSITWPSVEITYQGITGEIASGSTTIELTDLIGPIDTSYILIINGIKYQILDYTPQGVGTIPTEFVISPAIVADIEAETTWAMLKLPGQYNTQLSMKPGDLVFRHQVWKGTVNGDHEEGVTEINITGVSTEISDRWHDSNRIPPQGLEREFGIVGSSFNVGDDHYYGVIDHEPNSRSQHNYQYGSRGDHDPDNPGWDDLIWKPCGLPTTKLFLNSPLASPISGGTEFTIRYKHWYVVSVEHLGSQSNVSFETPLFCEGHKRECFDFFHLADSSSPARFEMMLHVIANEEAFDRLLDQGRVIPGDLLYHKNWHNWYQILPIYDTNGNMKWDEITFADFARTITVHDREELDFFTRSFDLNNIWVINHTHERQAWSRKILTGFDEDGNLTSRSWSRFKHHPTEFVYLEGRTEVSVR